MRKIIFSLIIFLSTIAANAKGDKTPVYLVAGQSNTDGRVSTRELPEYIRQNKYKHCYWSFGSGTTSGKGEFKLFWPHIDSQNDSHRWGYDAVVYYWLEQSLGRDFYVIKESLGGTSISPKVYSNQDMRWSADSAYLASTAAADKGGKSLLKAFTDNIGACIDNKLSKLKNGYEIKAFIWHQGESDRKVSELYHDNLKAVIDYVRNYLVKKTGNKKYAELPVILGGFSTSSVQWNQGLTDAQKQLEKEDKNIHVVDVPDATLRKDNIHFDAAGAEYLGRKVYDELVNLYLAGAKAKAIPF